MSSQPGDPESYVPIYTFIVDFYTYEVAKRKLQSKCGQFSLTHVVSLYIFIQTTEENLYKCV